MMDMTKDDRPQHSAAEEQDYYDSQCEPAESPDLEPLTLNPVLPDACRTRFYYIRNSNNHPIITVCLIRINDETARGLAICAPAPIRDRLTGRLVHDIPSKQRGRDLAAKRARRAIVKRANDKPIHKLEINALLWKLSTQTGCCLPSWKSEYTPSLTRFEHRLLYDTKPGANA